MRTFFYLLLISPWLGCSQTALPVFSENDTTIEVRVGNKFAVQLPSNIGTGYGWQLKEPADSSLVLELIQQLDLTIIQTQNQKIGGRKKVQKKAKEYILSYQNDQPSFGNAMEWQRRERKIDS